MKSFNNVTNIVRDDMVETITRDSRVSIAAACFSIYAFQELKRELTGELIEYRDCKIMAGKIAKQSDGFNHFYRNTMEIEKSSKYERLHEGDELIRFYLSAVGRGNRKLPPPIEAFTAIVTKKIVSVGSRISGIFSKLRSGKKHSFRDFFTDARSRSEMVATFLAMLELMKANKIKVSDDAENPEVLQTGELNADDMIFEYGGDENA